LGIKPQHVISQNDFDRIWKKYNENDNDYFDDFNEKLNHKQARKFLKHFAEALGTQTYSPKLLQLRRTQALQ
jgi:hypothetical protein